MSQETTFPRVLAYHKVLMFDADLKRLVEHYNGIDPHILSTGIRREFEFSITEARRKLELALNEMVEG